LSATFSGISWNLFERILLKYAIIKYFVAIYTILIAHENKYCYENNIAFHREHF
jgi:hypothetical protein